MLDGIATPALLALPDELLLQILTHVFHGPPNAFRRPSPNERRHSSSVLRVNRLLYGLGLPLFHQHVNIGVPGLCKLPDAAPLERRHGEATEQQGPLAGHMRSLAVELDYFSSPINSFGLTHSTFLAEALKHNSPCTCPNHAQEETLPEPKQACVYVSFETWSVLLNTRLAAFSARWPLYTRLTHLSIRAQQFSRTTDIFTRARRATRPFLDEATLLQCFAAVSRCTQLEVLELDTADADASRWSLDVGVGSACAVHVCEALHAAIEGLPRLRRLMVRRRDMCPRAVAFAVDSAVLRSGLLEEVVVDLRMTDTQQTGRETWEAHARHCGCCCWCMRCLRRWLEGSSERKYQASVLDQERDMHMGHQRADEGGKSLMDAMESELQRLARYMAVGKARSVQLWAYEAPATDMLGPARRAVVIDCVTGKRTQAGDML